jgi:hypothetical protein
MKFINIFINKDERFFIKREIKSEKLYLAFAVFNGLAEYNEYYEISEVEFKNFMNDENLLKAFVHECKDQKNDSRLLLKPGRLRGSAYS